MRVLRVLVAALAFTSAAFVSPDYGVAYAETRTATTCPRSPKIGQTASVHGRIVSANQGVIFVKDCRIVIFAQGNLRGCRKGGTVTARGRVQLYDLYPTMEAFFINPKKVSCTA
jgi:hypothetical protein